MPPVQELLQRGNELGKRASELTGIPFDPTPISGERTNESVETPTSPEVTEPVNTTVDVGSLGEQPLQTPQQNESTTVNETLDTVRSVATQTSPEEEEAERELRRQENVVLGLQEEQLEETKEEARLEEEAGIGQFEQEIVDINNAIRLKSSQLTQDLVSMEGQGRLSAVTRGREARARRQTAAEIEGLAAVAEAAKNNIIAAESRIERALTRKYGDLEQRINIAKEALEINESRFSRAEKKASRERQAELSVLEQQLSIKKEAEQRALQIINNAIANGMNPSKAAQLSEGVVNGSISESQVISEAGGFVDRLDRIAKQESIAASRTNRLLARAKAGDPDAISDLGFDPSAVETQLSGTERRQTRERVDANKALLGLAYQYRALIEEHGYTNTIFGDPTVVGQTRSLMAQMTAVYKDAKTLGTLDEGLLTLMEKLLGEEPTSTFNVFKNLTGKQSATTVSQINSLITSAQSELARDTVRLGGELHEGVLTDEDISEAESLIGETEKRERPFTPEEYYEQ